MPASVNNRISVADYNAIRSIAASVMGVGSASRGYGQPLNSVALTQNQLVSQTDWDNVRFDLLNARIHQNGSGALTEINENQTISAAGINLFESLRTTIDNDRFLVANGQFLTVSNVSTVSRAYSGTVWKNEINTILTVTFTDANRARYFFNSGGTIGIESTRIDGSRTDAQNISWRNLIRDFGGLRAFGGAIPARNFYNLTDGFQEYYSASASSPYGSNKYALEARCNVSNNSLGTANIVYLRIRFIDGYRDPDALAGNPELTNPPNDGVDGTFTVSVTEKRAEAIGGLLPNSENFVIQRPTYSIAAITGT
jgi:hypothetical protein